MSQDPLHRKEVGRSERAEERGTQFVEKEERHGMMVVHYQDLTGG